MGWECLEISCKVISVPCGDLRYSEHSWGFFVLSPQLYPHPVLRFVMIFPGIPEKTKLLSGVF